MQGTGVRFPAIAVTAATAGGSPAATPIGMKVWAEAELTAVEGRKLIFSVTAYDEAGQIGQGTHERFVITPSKFLAKTQAKLG